MFSSGVFTIKEGKNIEENDKNSIIVHEEFAKQNNLKLGDEVDLELLDIEKSGKIKSPVQNLGISVQQVEKSDYGQKLGAIAGITGFKKDGSRYSGADFPAELLVFSGINSSQMDIFLAEYKKAAIEPIGCKAVVTPDNVFWSADKLFREIFREHLFMNR